MDSMTLEELNTMTLEDSDLFESLKMIDPMTFEEMDSLTPEDIDLLLRTEPGGRPELKRYLYERQRELRKRCKQQRKKQRRQQRKQQLKRQMPFMDWAQGGDQNHGIIYGIGGMGKSNLISSLSGFKLQEWTESHQDSKDQEVHVFEIPGLLATHSMKALGDYGAKKNFIKEKLAVRIGLPINRDLVCKVTVASGQPVTTTGAVTAPFRFKGEHNIHDLTFHLLPECIHDVILGKPFLKLTETFSKLTNFYRRVKERVVKGISQFHLLYLGASSPMFEGSVNGQPQAALADSGSKVLVMDEAYAQSIGALIQTGREDQTTLTFADNSTADTCGMAYGVQWRFGRDGEFTSPYQLNFHILKNAPANVILCDTFLHHNRAFSMYNHYLTNNDNDYEDDEPNCFAIDIDKRKKWAKTTPIASSLADLQYLELIRRGEEEDRISSLSMDEQTIAQNIENQRCAEWDRAFTAIQTDSQARNRLQPSEIANFQSQSTQAARSGTISPQGSGSSLTIGRHFWKWLTKPKRR